MDKTVFQSKAWFSSELESNLNSLYSFAMRLCRNTSDAEDLVAEALMKAWQAIGSLKDKERFRPWIFCILRNLYVSQLRKTSNQINEIEYVEEDCNEVKNEIASLLIEQPDEFLNWWANPEYKFVNQLVNEDIMKAITDLPEVYRETIILVNLEGFYYDEAAEALDVSPGTIRSRMNRGRTLLQKALWQHAKDANIIS